MNDFSLQEIQDLQRALVWPAIRCGDAVAGDHGLCSGQCGAHTVRVEAVARTSQLILLLISWPAVTSSASAKLNLGMVTLVVVVDVRMRTRARCI